MERTVQALIDAGLANEAGDNVSVVLLTLAYGGKGHGFRVATGG